MALSATTYHFHIGLSDVDRGVYETLDLRLAMHPSESMRYMLTRTIAYCMEYTEGIAFSKGGLSANEEPPVAVHDLTGKMLAWIDVGAPSAERLHKACKATGRVALYTHVSMDLLRKEAASRAIHKIEAVQVFRLEQSFLSRLESPIERKISFDITRNDGLLYVAIGGETLECPLTAASLLSA
jgi:uncharacterized protein YaeQ